MENGELIMQHNPLLWSQSAFELHAWPWMDVPDDPPGIVVLVVVIVVDDIVTLLMH